MMCAQFGLDRGSNVYELAYAEYQFHVMHDAFLVHRGFKEEAKLHESRVQEMITNRRIFISEFIPGLRAKYPHIVNGVQYFDATHPAVVWRSSTIG